MKRLMMVLACAMFVFAAAGCKEKTTEEKAQDTVRAAENDAAAAKEDAAKKAEEAKKEAAKTVDALKK